MADMQEMKDVCARYRAALGELKSAIWKMFADATPDQREISRALGRVLSFREMFEAIDDGSVEIEWLAANRKLIHDAFSAPGGWGYETDIGKALQALYRINLRIEDTDDE